MKKSLCAVLCFILAVSVFAFPAKADYVFDAPSVTLAEVQESENDVTYRFTLSCSDAAAYEKRRLDVYSGMSAEYSDEALIAAGQSWLVYETVLLVEAEKNGQITYICERDVRKASFSLSLCADILPELVKGGLYTNSASVFVLRFSVVLKYKDDYIDASSYVKTEAISCPATAKIEYFIDEKAVNPNPRFIFAPFEDFSLGNPTLEGYTFAGWETENGFINTIPANTQSISLTARWNARTYKRNYVLTTRKGPFIYVDNTSNPKQRLYGQETEIFAVNAPMDYVFCGWYENASFTGEPVTKITADRTGDILLFAKWLTEEEAENQKLIEEKWGDLDGDGGITAADARLALRAAVGLEKFSGELLSRVDFEGNGLVTAGTARHLLRIAVRLDTLKNVLTLYGRLENDD